MVTDQATINTPRVACIFNQEIDVEQIEQLKKVIVDTEVRTGDVAYWARRGVIDRAGSGLSWVCRCPIREHIPLRKDPVSRSKLKYCIQLAREFATVFECNQIERSLSRDEGSLHYMESVKMQQRIIRLTEGKSDLVSHWARKGVKSRAEYNIFNLERWIKEHPDADDMDELTCKLDAHIAISNAVDTETDFS